MRTNGQTSEDAISANDPPVEGPRPEPTLTFELPLSDAEALRAWLLKSTADGSTALDDPFVSHALGSLGQAVDAARATANVRRELKQVGLGVDHLTDEQVRALGQRISEAALPAIRA